MCPKCRHQLHARDLVPILSWVELRGRCRYCSKPIHWQYPIVELLTSVLFVISFLEWPGDFSAFGILGFGFWLVSLVLLLTLAIYDIRWMLLPDKLVYPLIATSTVVTVCLAIAGNDWHTVASAAVGGIGLSGLFYLLFVVSGGTWIGGGDVKLALGLGLLAGGIVETILLLFIASLAGTMASLPLLVRHKQLSQKVPFGPFLILASIIVFFWGSQMIDTYSRFIGV